jgi:hypothetical protein
MSSGEDDDIEASLFKPPNGWRSRLHHLSPVRRSGNKQSPATSSKQQKKKPKRSLAASGRKD